MRELRIIELAGYEENFLALQEFSEEAAENLWHNYGKKVDVQWPSPKTNHRWKLTAQGWVGYIPLTPQLAISLQPKVPLGNLFRMWEYAYQFDFDFLEGLMACDSLREFYEQLANILARRVLDRARRGFHRAYVGREERLPYVRGRVDVGRSVRRPLDIKLHCHYQEHTPDIEYNRILAWTLRCIARSGSCTERVLPTVRKAYRALHGVVTLTPYNAEDCERQRYSRLNEDYETLHTLCRFFLAHSGPTHLLGEHTMLPFLVYMPGLYERFVAEWMKQHLPPGLTIKAQDTVHIGQDEDLEFRIDLTLYDEESSVPRYVLDTKYKVPSKLSTADIAQIVTYAHTKDCQEALLVYPSPPDQPLDVWNHDIHIRSATFALDGNLEANGHDFLQQVGLAPKRRTDR